MNKRLFFSIAIIFLGLALSGIYYFKTIYKDSSKKFEILLDHYKKNEKEPTLELAKSWQSELINYDQGCELLISIFAEARSFQELEQISRTCINKKPTPENVYDGLSFALKETNRAKEAIEILEAMTKDHQDDNLYHSLANLYWLENNKSKSREFFLKLISKSSIWSAWLSRVLKQKELAEDKDFLISLTEEVVKKPLAFEKVESSLLEKLKIFKLEESSKMLRNHMEQHK